MAEAGAAPQIVAIVDDDPFIRTALGRLVRSRGHEAVVFDDARAVLAHPGLGDLSCILADLQMPGMNGVELIQILAGRVPSPPVVAMTAYPGEAIRQRALEAGAAAYLTKPFDAAQLQACLQALGITGGM